MHALLTCQIISGTGFNTKAYIALVKGRLVLDYC
jgi:hypothetical protein